MSAALPFRRSSMRTLALVAIAGISATKVSAQSQTEQTLYRTRPQLDSIASALERGGKPDEAAAVRERLRVGDFYPGDRVVIELFGAEEPFRDTVSVRTGQEVIIQAFPAFTLKGVLRSEADSALAAQASKFIQRPVVRTQPQVRFLVTGAVGRPGFVTLRGDAAVSDVITAAGGLTQTSKLDKSKIRRGGEVLLGADSLRTVLRVGMTLDQADIRAGDELVVEQKSTRNWLQLVWVTSSALGLITTLIRLSR